MSLRALAMKSSELARTYEPTSSTQRLLPIPATRSPSAKPRSAIVSQRMRPGDFTSEPVTEFGRRVETKSSPRHAVRGNFSLVTFPFLRLGGRPMAEQRGARYGERMKVREIMTRGAHCVAPETPVIEAAGLMRL